MRPRLSSKSAGGASFWSWIVELPTHYGPFGPAPPFTVTDDNAFDLPAVFSASMFVLASPPCGPSTFVRCYLPTGHCAATNSGICDGPIALRYAIFPWLMDKWPGIGWGYIPGLWIVRAWAYRIHSDCCKLHVWNPFVYILSKAFQRGLSCEEVFPNSKEGRSVISISTWVENRRDFYPLDSTLCVSSLYHGQKKEGNIPVSGPGDRFSRVAMSLPTTKMEYPNHIYKPVLLAP